MSSGRRGPLVTRLLLELLLVVVGVLIALGAESVWQSRKEATRASEHLLALVEDLAEAEQLIEQRLTATAGQQGDVEAAKDALRGATPPPPDDLVVIGWTGVPTLPLTTLESLVATGDIRLLDPDLQRVLIRERSRFASLERTHATLFDLASTNIRDWYFARARLDVAPGIAREPTPGASMATAWGVPEFLAIYDLHAGLLSDLRSTLQETREALQRIRDATSPTAVSGAPPIARAWLRL